MQLIFEKSQTGRRASQLPALDVPKKDLGSMIPAAYQRKKPPRLPSLSEPEVVRHYTALSRRNHGVDSGFYPLGSCTMKYNPKLHEDIARLPGFARLHPLQPETTAQGALFVMHELEQALGTITGMHRFTLQPAAGAHGELTGLLMIKAYLEAEGKKEKDEMLIPDSAHGTNPASAALAGFKVVEIPSDQYGRVDLAALRQAVGAKTAGIMLTNPNTLGLFEKDIEEIAAAVHEAGGLLYYDGANANAILGQVRPGDMGFDVVHLNLHKTFSTPHGGGGPGSGPIGVTRRLEPFLPVPLVKKQGDRFLLDFDRPQSIGRMKGFHGHFSILLRALSYILTLGGDGLQQTSEIAVLHANYLQARLKEIFDLPHDRHCMHEFVLSAKTLRDETGISALHVAKALLDRGFHPPTVYFPLIVREALMIEPTETESKETLDAFCQALQDIVRQARENPQALENAPQTLPVTRLDEVKAARKPIFRHAFEESP